MTDSLLDDLIGRFGALPERERIAVAQSAEAISEGVVWVPNPGPQTDAYFSEADELFYGGQAGGGKSDLLIGLGLTAHTDSLILRRVNDDAKDLARRAREIAGEGAGYNGQDKILTLGKRNVRFSGCQYEDDKERFKGRARDLFGFDEISDFTESIYKFVTTWNRSARPGQRSRIVAAGNPPTRPEGLWVVRYWAAWLDEKHPNPAKPGELRWYIRGENDEDVEVDGRGPHVVAWQPHPIYAKSRTFIPAALADNPDQNTLEYRASLDSLPAHLRSAYRDGNFQAELRDDDFQVIPTSWILAAIERWKPTGWQAHNMTAMACDAAGGGADPAVIAYRHHGWFAPVISVQGEETADGSRMAARIISHRRHSAPVIIDAGGGYGGSYALRLKDNGVEATAFNGAAATAATTNDAAGLSFVNRRAEVYWRMREALDPNQEGGSVIALPPDDELKADLAAPHWELTRSGIKLESKDDIKARIGRSPNRGDAVCYALSEGDKAVKRRIRRDAMGGAAPTVSRGYARLKDKRR